MSAKQYQIVFGYFLRQRFGLITAIIDLVAQFYVIQENWSYSSSGIIDLEDNNEYCEWSKSCGYVDEYVSVCGNVLFKLDEMPSLTWEIEFAMPHRSENGLFIGLSNYFIYTIDNPESMHYDRNQMFAGYAIDFWGRQNDNPYIERCVKGQKVMYVIGSGVKMRGDRVGVVQPDDFVFGTIRFTVNIDNDNMYQSLSVYPHPHSVRSNKMCCISDKIILDANFQSKSKYYWLACSLPFGSSLKLNCFCSSGEFHYRNEWD